MSLFQQNIVKLLFVAFCVFN